MATLAEIGRQRKAQLKQLLLASRTLDAKQEAVEREIKRISNRKQAVPEITDVQRLLTLLRAVEAALGVLIRILDALSKSWSYT